MTTTDNFRKHTSTNPVQRRLIDNFLNTLIQEIKPRNPKNILDVGCGEGFTLKRLLDEKIGQKLEGVDFLKTAIELGKKQYPMLALKQGDIYNLPYHTGSFDLVLCTEVLEHVEEPEKALKELKRVSAKYLLLSVPNEPIFMGANFIRGKNWKRWGNDIEHINHWSTFQFQALIKKHGLKITIIKHPFPWTMLLVEK